SSSLYVGGSFAQYQGVAAPKIIKVTDTGARDVSFVSGAGFDNGVTGFAAGPAGSGSIYAWGYFTTYQGAPAGSIVRLNSDGSRNNTFAVGVGFDDEVYAVLPLADGSGL